MKRRWLAALGLSLTIGCSGGKGGASRDAATDQTDDLGTSADATRDVIVIGGGGAGDDAGRDARDTSAEVAADGPDADARANVDGADTGDGATEAPVQSTCPAQITTISLPAGPVTGTLSAKSNNPIVSCQGDVVTDGPDAFYALTLAQTTTVDFHVSAAFETFVAVRAGPCSDSISEVACGQDQSLDVLPASGSSFDGGFAGFGAIPIPPFDAGADAASDGAADVSSPADAGADAVSPFQTDLRVRLAAGTYTIVVDTLAESATAGETYTLTATAIQPLANGTCATPTLLASGATAPDQSLDLAGAPSAVCGSARAALYYSVGVPPGQRLTARATPKRGDREWMPRLTAFTACSSSSCIAQGHSTSGTTQELDWTNNGANWQLVDLAVTTDGPVTGATFDLNVAVLDLMATCSRPTTIKDGTTLLAQDLSIAPSVTSNPCNGNTEHVFFYSATLLPLQTVDVSINPTASSSIPFFVNMGLISSCDESAQCSQSNSDIQFTNSANTSTTVLFEVSSEESGLSPVFDLHVSMPPPPAHVVVTPTSGLVTSESGTTATFQISLTSPPTSTVSIAVASDTPTEGKATPATVSFTPATWTMPVTVTVQGVDDSVSDGPQSYKIITSPAVSTDPRYQGMDPDDVSCTNLDNDPGIELIGADDVVTSESGRTSTFSVQLNSAPTASVTLPLTSSNTAEGTVSPAHLVFDATNWNKPQTVTVTGVDDNVADGTQAYAIVTGALVSADAAYNGQNPPDVTAHNDDDDYGPVTLKLLSGDHSCTGTNQFPLAIDELDRIYVVMSCEMGLWLTTSNDGGVTFTDPALIPNTTDAFSSLVELAAGPGGFIYLAYQNSSDGVSFLRSIDAGATWSTPLSLVQQTNQLQMAAVKKTLAILTDGSSSQVSMLLWRSVDGGANFLGPTSIADTNLGVGISPDGLTDWLVELSGSGALEKSTDGGATFTTAGTVGSFLFPFMFGAQNLFGFGNDQLLIESLADLTKFQQGSMSYDAPMAITVDDAQTATALDDDPTSNRLRVTRIRADATPPDMSQKLIGPQASTAGVAPLSRKAVAVGINTGGVNLFTTVTFP